MKKLLILILTLTLTARAAPLYTVTLLDGLGDSSRAVAINNAGQVAGSAMTPGDTTHAVRWTGRAAQDLGWPGVVSEGLAINASGQVAGFFLAAGGIPEVAVRWTGTVPDTLAAYGYSSEAYGINASGQVAGSVSNGVLNLPVRWADTGTGGPVQILSRLNDYVWSGAYAISDTGTAVGYLTAPDGSHSLPGRWNGRLAEVLPGGFGEALGINGGGQIVGDLGGTAVLWTNDLPIGLWGAGWASGINAKGEAVGMSGVAPRPMLYTDGAAYLLDTLLPADSAITNLTIAKYSASINDFGQIAATGTIAGVEHALRLDPIATPEPSSALLLLGGGLLLARRRNTNSKASYGTL